MSFSEWQSTALAEVMDIIGGGTPKTTIEEYWNGNINWISVKDFSGDSKHIFDTEKTITELGLEKSSTKLLQPKDIIISARGTVGELGVIKKPMAFNQSCYGLRAKQGYDPDYLYYLLKNCIKVLQNNTHGSVFSTITKDTFNQISVNIPPLQEQKAIANILSSLDEKIELNKQRNKTLEKIAQTLFKRWFVDFEFPNEEGNAYKSNDGEMVDSELGMIPRGWEVKALKDVLNTLEAGNRPKGGAVTRDNVVPSIGAENIIALGKYDFSKEKYVPREYFTRMKKGIVKSGDVLLYKDGAQLGRKTMFKNGFPHEECCINSHVFILRSNQETTQEFLYFWLDQDYMTKNIINLNANSAQPGINQSQVNTLKILCPNKGLLDKFSEITRQMLDNIFMNAKENITLSSIRDALLPKLMSGEIRVSDIEN